MVDDPGYGDLAGYGGRDVLTPHLDRLAAAGASQTSIPMPIFNLERDPGEQQDLAVREPRIVQELTAVLQLHLQRAGAVPLQRPSTSVVWSY